MTAPPQDYYITILEQDLGTLPITGEAELPHISARCPVVAADGFASAVKAWQLKSERPPGHPRATRIRVATVNRTERGLRLVQRDYALVPPTPAAPRWEAV